MKWRDYDLERDRELDSWILPSYSENAALINEFAFYDESVSEQYIWYLKNPEKLSTTEYWFKVVEIDGKVMALLILKLLYENGKNVLSIDPIAVNPRFINQGYGTKIIKDLIENVETIIGRKVDTFHAAVEEKNILSKKVFAKLGFVEKKRSEDGEFIYLFL